MALTAFEIAFEFIETNERVFTCACTEFTCFYGVQLRRIHSHTFVIHTLVRDSLYARVTLECFQDPLARVIQKYTRVLVFLRIRVSTFREV